MVPEVRIISQLAHLKIFECTSNSESDLKAWLANGKYLMHSALTVKNTNANIKTSNHFELFINDKNSLYQSLSYDCNRFSQAAIESMYTIKQDENLPKSSGWATVQMYYASFFAVHAILRIFGRSCSQLERSHVKKVHDIAVATNHCSQTSSIENGFYSSTINVQNNTLEFSKLKDSHADTWGSFNALLSDLISDIPDKTTGIQAHRLSAMDLLSKIKGLISKSGSLRGNWLSTLRNQINYQHTHGVWFPYRSPSFSPELINRNLHWTNPPTSFDTDTKKNDIEVLFNTSNIIVSLLFSLLKVGFDKGDKKSHNLKNGVFRLTNQLDIN